MQSGANTDATRSTDHVWLNTLIVTSSCAQQLGLNSWVLASCLSSEFGGCRTGLEPGCRGCSRAGLASQATGAVPIGPTKVNTLGCHLGMRSLVVTSSAVCGVLWGQTRA